MSEQNTPLHAGLAGLTLLNAKVLPLWAAQIDNARVQTEDAICAITSRFFQLTTEIDTLVGASGTNESAVRIKGMISDLLVSLQFQDRTSQILSGIRNDMNRLAEKVAGGDTDLDPDAWLKTLAASYSTLEQQRIHEGDADASSAMPDESELTFF